MKLAISNLAWPSRLDSEVADTLAVHGVDAIEAAPGRLNEDPTRITLAQAAAFRRVWAARGIGVSAMQALFFGGPTCSLFAGVAARRELADHLVLIAEVAATLDAPLLVFGSPRNRARGDLPHEEAMKVAAEFFFDAAERIQAYGARIVIEPIPAAYGCDFLNTAAEALRLAQATDELIGMHLDSGCMTLAGEAVDEAIANAASRLCHFHVSEKDLAPIGSGTVRHEAFAAALKANRYEKRLSVEMRETSTPVASIDQALRHARGAYG